MQADTTQELQDLLEEVRRIQVWSQRLVHGVMAGGYSSVFRGSGLEIHELREYQPGDDPRSIDWNVTARSGRPFVREYVEERDLTMLFLLDLSSSMQGGHGIWSARQMAARLLACLALSAIDHDDRVGLLGFSDRIERFVPPRRGLRHALRLVRDCLALPGSASATDLGPALEFAARGLRRHAVVFLVSDFLAEGWDEALRLCADRHDLVCVRLLMPELDAPLPEGLVRMEEAESGRRRVLDGSDPGVQEAWREEVEAWRSGTAERIQRAGADLMDVPVPLEPDRDAVVRPILDFFRMREQREIKR